MVKLTFDGIVFAAVFMRFVKEGGCVFFGIG